MVDQGCVYHDYAIEFARTVLVGKPSSDQKKAYRGVHDSLSIAARAIKAGITAGEIDRIARRTLEDDDFGSYQHPYPTGHG